MAQLDLGIYRHSGQQFENLESMSYQIVDSILRVINEKLGKPLTGEEKEQLVVSYEENVNHLLGEYEKAASRLRKIEHDLVYSHESDLEKMQLMKKIIYETLKGKHREKRKRYFTFPSWRRINERTGNYFILKEMLRRRSNQSTWSRLRECNLLS